MGLIKGENISLYINGELMSCWRSSQIDITADTIGKSTIGSGNWKEFEGVALSWTASGEGQIYNAVSFTIHDAYILMATLTPVFLVFTIDDKDAAGTVLNTMYYFGIAIITNINLTGSVNNIASYNIAFQGTGELSIDDDNALYGNYPENFELTGTTPDTPIAGQVTLDFAWDAATPEPDNYRIEVYDVTADVLTYWDGGTPGNTMSIFLDDTHSYTFRIKSAYFDYTYFSEYSPVIITWP